MERVPDGGPSKLSLRAVFTHVGLNRKDFKPLLGSQCLGVSTDGLQFRQMHHDSAQAVPEAPDNWQRQVLDLKAHRPAKTL